MLTKITLYIDEKNARNLWNSLCQSMEYPEDELQEMGDLEMVESCLAIRGCYCSKSEYEYVMEAI